MARMDINIVSLDRFYMMDLKLHIMDFGLCRSVALTPWSLTTFCWWSIVR